MKEVPHEKVIHKPANILVKRPPTEILIHHAPLIVKPSSVTFHNPGRIIHRPHIQHNLPQKYHIRPVYINIVKPIRKNVLLTKKSNDSSKTPVKVEKIETQVQQPKQNASLVQAKPVNYASNAIKKTVFYKNFRKNFDQ